MKISLINGSQKPGESNSGVILNWLNDLIKDKHEVSFYSFGLKQLSDETLKKIAASDVIVLAFPLFVYTLPSHTLKMMIELEKIIRQTKADNLAMYVIINNGFFEGKQNDVAFEVIKHWCEHSGVKFCGGIGQGAGEMIGQTKQLPLSKSPFNNLGRALQTMVEKMESKTQFEITYLSPYFPKFLWKLMAVRLWNDKAKKNGLTKEDIIRKME